MNLYDIVNPMTMAEAKTDYEKRRQRERDVDAGKPVARQRASKQTDYQKKRAQDKKDMALGEDSWHAGDNAWSSDNHEMVEGQLSVGDPIVVTAPNEFEGKTGEIAEFSPSGKFVVVNLYNYGQHSMHLSDVEYNQYADEEDADEYGEYEDDLNEFAPNPERDEDEVPDQILQLANRWWNATDKQPQITNVLRSLGWSIAQVESEDDAVQMQHDDGTTYFISADDFDPEVFEGFQDFNRVEPYAVCLAGKPVKKFDYYEDARRFHDNWKKKLYNAGEQAKADTITLMPLNLDEGDDLGNLDAEVFGRIDKEKQRRADLKKNDPAAYAKEMEKDSKNYGRGIMGALRRKYDQPLDEAMNKNDLLGNVAKDLNTQFKKAKSGKLKASGDFTKGDHWQGAKPGDYGYTGYQGHGMPKDNPKKNKGVAESATAPIIVPKRRVKAKPEPKFDIPYSADDYVPPALAMASAEALDRIIADPSTKETTRELAKKAKAQKQGVGEAIVASGPSRPLDDRAVRKLVWDTMKINADTGEQAIQRALSVLAKKPQSRMVLDLQDKFQNLSDRLAQGLAEMDKSQKGAPGWNIDDYDYNKGKWTQGTPVKAKDAVKDMHKELNKAFKKPVKESYWTKLQDQRNTKLNTLVNELKESVKK